MPGVLEPDCRVKPEVKSFNRLETKLAGSLHFYNRATLLLRIKTRLRWNLYLLGGGSTIFEKAASQLAFSYALTYRS
jgi:hypothetical protein